MTARVSIPSLKAVLALSAAICLGGAVLYLYADYRRAVDAADRRLAEIAEVSTRYVQQVLGLVDLALRSMDENAATDDIVVTHDPLALHDVLKRIQKVSPALQGLGVVNRDGLLVGSAQTVWPRQVDLSDREHYRVHRDNPKYGLFIGRPVVSRPDNVLSVPVSRRIVSLAGGFHGVLAARLDGGFFAQFFAATGADVVALFRQDGVLLARYPPLDVLTAPVLPPDADLLKASRQDERGWFTSVSPFDGIDRMVAFQNLAGDTPLILVTSYDRATLFADWALRSIPFALLAITVLGLIGMIALAARRQERIGLHLLQAQSQARQSAEIAAELAEQSKLDALASQQKKIQFLAQMSHELRTPLNAIMGFSEVIQRQILGPANPKYPEYAADIHHSADHLLSMINEILDHSKLEAGKWRLQESEFAVVDWLASTLRVARGRAERAGVVLDIRPPPAALAAYGDERILLQALLNLVANAIKFAGPDRLVAVSCHWAEGQELRVEVRDRGPGMTPAEAAQALRPYESGSGARARSEEGTGLGLPLASSFVALHGGTLTLDSAPGRGTAAILALPAARIRVPAAA